MTRIKIAQVAMGMSVAIALLLGCSSSRGPASGGYRPPTSDFDEKMTSQVVSKGGSAPALRTVYFDYDRAEVRDDQAEALKNNSSAIARSQGWRLVVVEGHSDERGSEEYNLALGERRANAVKSYLMNLGIEGKLLDTVSFGESRPAETGHAESAWRWNRRVTFSVTR